MPEAVFMVLLVDDHAMVAEAIRRMLIHESDIDFHYCANPEEAVAAAHRIKPTVILQDLVMPGVDGLTLLKRYRTDPVTKDIPVIVLSIKEEPEVKSQAFAAGASDYLVKLPDHVELVARIRLHSTSRLNQLQRDEAYQAVRESQQQLVASNTELVSLNRKLEEVTRAKTEFLAYMSHEIRTPMNGVLGMTTLLRDTPLSAAQIELVETIRNSGDSLLTIVNDILDFSKVEAGRIDLEARPFHLWQSIEDAMKVLAPRASEKGLDLVLHIDPGVPQVVVGDVTRLRQVLLNLLSNAIKFTERGSVTLSAETEARRTSGEIGLHFAVGDTGVGIPADRMDRLFKPFAQIDSSTSREFGGTGLGLVISKRLAELMGGDISVESEPGHGSTFHFSITVVPGSTAPAAVDAGTDRTADASFAKRWPLRLLLADDNVINQRVGVGLLKRLGYTVDVAANGAQVLLALDTHVYDVILLDVHMPDMDGYETARRIRAKWPANEPGRPRMIATTASAMQSDRDRCLEAGMDDYVSKPMQVEMLQAALERCGTR
jgi:signal transduction histidine kinase